MTRVHAILAGTAALLAAGAAVADMSAGNRPTHDDISVLELGQHIMEDSQALLILDLRSAEDYEQFHIPSAQPARINCTSECKLDASRIPANDASIVLYAESDERAREAVKQLRELGYSRARFVRGGVDEWIARVLEPLLADGATPEERAEFEQAAQLSRFFGGVARAGVPRSEILTDRKPLTSTRETVRNLRRRGC
jgi:rhodanese-related sulfurtransferase